VWLTCFRLSLAVLTFFVVFAVWALWRRWQKVRPLYFLVAGVFTAGCILQYPIWQATFAGVRQGVFKAVLVAVQNTFQFFTADADFTSFSLGVAAPEPGLQEWYILLGTVLLVLAPVLTFGFLLTFFKGAYARLRMLFHLPANMYVFSELNARSIALAEDIRQRERWSFLVFTNAPRDEEHLDDDLLHRLQLLRAAVYREDISLIWLRSTWGKHKSYLFTMCDREAESISETLQLIQKYRRRRNTLIYLFSHNIDSELMLNNVDKGRLIVRRINPTVSLVNHILTTEGTMLFDNAVPTQDGSRLISVLVLGMGQLGAEMIRALAWYGQMDGYTIQIHGFDTDAGAADRLRARCPELLDERYNGRYQEGEPYYRIQLHQADVRGAAFREQVKALGTVTHAIVALGDDSLNAAMAVELRVLFEQMHIHPRIATVISESERLVALRDAKDRGGRSYDLHFIGDINTVYSHEVIINAALQEEALALHKRYNNDDPYGFFEFEYNYCSSMASVIHYAARQHCGIPGAGKREEELTDTERRIIEVLEHKRWNAYMRAEGYIYSGSPDKASRNDMGRMHHNLVVFDELSEEDKRKDSRVGTL